jgi:hypothetical protein
MFLVLWKPDAPHMRLRRHGHAVVLAPMFGEDHATLVDVAFGADERVVLAASEARSVVRYHARQDQTPSHTLYNASVAL